MEQHNGNPAAKPPRLPCNLLSRMGSNPALSARTIESISTIPEARKSRPMSSVSHLSQMSRQRPLTAMQSSINRDKPEIGMIYPLQSMNRQSDHWRLSVDKSVLENWLGKPIEEYGGFGNRKISCFWHPGLQDGQGRPAASRAKIFSA